ncbi:yteA family sporulation protein [Salibacterium salarium]|uniref:YteA family sporulation protein n=1 Tax=Salibacterium salarium TaxID=284579 RepID=A0A3R9RA15_9BACI|nr:TraR/DksA C4-type zinc finger protein [Salibacterium salarium]RSL30622.1 yteA family sporulation protein [Salibacterium salarium]
MVKTNSFFQDIKKRLNNRLHELQHRQSEHGEMDVEFAQESIGELSNYDNHPADQATGLYEREKDLALEQHTDREEIRIQKALEAIDEGTYGTCRKCGADIPIERLKAEPTALECVHHSYDEPRWDDRPVEEDRLIPGKGGFTNTTTEGVENDRFDAEETWEQTAAYGSSDTPQDTYNPSEFYEGMFGDADSETGEEDMIDGFSMTDSEGNPIDFDHDVDFSNVYLRR